MALFYYLTYQQATFKPLKRILMNCFDRKGNEG